MTRELRSVTGYWKSIAKRQRPQPLDSIVRSPSKRSRLLRYCVVFDPTSGSQDGDPAFPFYDLVNHFAYIAPSCFETSHSRLKHPRLRPTLSAQEGDPECRRQLDGGDTGNDFRRRAPPRRQRQPSTEPHRAPVRIDPTSAYVSPFPGSSNAESWRNGQFQPVGRRR